ncbi:MAG: hypothetical protein A2663_03635 [Candidatus Buchananbacteria bacterium RIFCSPHIGHO2_01_FULL_46_12]|uniref:Glucose-1-phosphate thymidylyltransferase n=1 Tax=Candidatus Buchananbacteria bacterium RIFCSPHIGHO2_01_FULL_46_12 TaxID=1797536 RepID=A0A1G1Y9G5_9BACT|nr:MAG: hypothetical protein A2663_03635 [Candidatus Buchananbacteria bacterium RIFCSPHIGHO2_01_FULL_46_12]
MNRIIKRGVCNLKFKINLTMKIILYENNQVEKLYPLTLTRPSFDIFCGALTLFGAIEKIFPDCSIDYEVRDYLLATTERKYLRKDAGESETLFLDGSLIPSLEAAGELAKLVLAGKEAVFKSGGRVVGGFCLSDGVIPFPLTSDYPLASARGSSDKSFGAGAGSEGAMEDRLNELNLPAIEIDWPVFNYPWEVITFNQEILADNLAHLKKYYKEIKPDVYVGREVILPPQIVLNSSHGPIIIDEGSRVLPFCHLVGPLYIGKNCLIREFTVLKYGCCLGPVCKAGGEIEASIFQGYGNKNHHGFFGYSYLGEWVNLGAGTTTSNLKNSYGLIKVFGADTGQQFLGSIIGDYSRTAVNTPIYAGKVIGASSHLYGTVVKDIPSFTAYAASFGCAVEFDLAEAIKIQKIVMARRNFEASEIDRQLLKDVFALTQAEREKMNIKPGKLEFKI